MSKKMERKNKIVPKCGNCLFIDLVPSKPRCLCPADRNLYYRKVVKRRFVCPNWRAYE